MCLVRISLPFSTICGIQRVYPYLIWFVLDFLNNIKKFHFRRGGILKRNILNDMSGLIFLQWKLKIRFSKPVKFTCNKEFPIYNFYFDCMTPWDPFVYIEIFPWVILFNPRVEEEILNDIQIYTSEKHELIVMVETIHKLNMFKWWKRCKFLINTWEEKRKYVSCGTKYFFFDLHFTMMESSYHFHLFHLKSRSWQVLMYRKWFFNPDSKKTNNFRVIFKYHEY